MTELMDGVVYDWTPKEPMKHPSGAFEDVIRFLNSNFMIFTKLPVSICEWQWEKWILSLFNSLSLLVLIIQ